MENSPEMFHSLELEYTISGRLTSKRTINVFGSHFEKSRLWSKMINMNTGSSIRYLKSEDLKQLSTETARKIVASVKTDSDYTVTGNELKIHEVIEKVLSENKVDVSKFNDVKWDSVYWDSDMARPDKQTSYLNKFYSKNDTDDSLSTTKNESTEVGRTYGATVGYGGFTVGANYGTTDKEGNSLTVEQMKRQLKESDSHVQWNGEKFAVRPMDLYRLDLSNMSASTNFATADIQVQRIASLFSIKILTDDTLKEQNRSFTPALLQRRLEKKLKQLKMEMIDSIAELEADFYNGTENLIETTQKLDNELQNLKNETRIEMATIWSNAEQLSFGIQNLTKKSEKQGTAIHNKIDTNFREIAEDISSATRNLTLFFEQNAISLQSSFNGRIDSEIEKLGDETADAMSRIQAKFDGSLSDMAYEARDTADDLKQYVDATGLSLQSSFDYQLRNKISDLAGKTNNLMTRIQTGIDNDWTRKPLCVLQYNSECPSGFLDEMYMKATLVKNSETPGHDDADDSRTKNSYLNGTDGGASWYLIVCCK